MSKTKFSRPDYPYLCLIKFESCRPHGGPEWQIQMFTDDLNKAKSDQQDALACTNVLDYRIYEVQRRS